MLSENCRNTKQTIKFLCSYGGNIYLRSSDRNLRYLGGHTRVLAVDRSISFTELMVKLVEFCGFSVELKCQLPNGDLETLVSIKSEKELCNIIELYDVCCPDSKIRAVLFPPKSIKKVSPPPSADVSPAKLRFLAAHHRQYRNIYSPPGWNPAYRNVPSRFFFDGKRVRNLELSKLGLI